MQEDRKLDVNYQREDVFLFLTKLLLPFVAGVWVSRPSLSSSLPPSPSRSNTDQICLGCRCCVSMSYPLLEESSQSLQQ